MASTSTNGSVPNFYLTPQQQTLLFAALNSNKDQAPDPHGLSLSPSSFQSSPLQNNIQESPFLDNYDYDFADSSLGFDYSGVDQPKMIGDIPDPEQQDSVEADGPEKRSHPDDDDEESVTENNGTSGNKRRESTEKVPKKPGRKPLTSEPSSKRKAQNRAAQRAFRERKEKHLKDLETKVEELEKVSEAANHENELLRAKIEQMTSELDELKKKATLIPNRPVSTQRSSTGFGQAAISNLGDVNFHFEFPRFGVLPGPASAANKPTQRSTSAQSSPAAVQLANSPVSPDQRAYNFTASPPSLDKDDLAKASSLFSPPLTMTTSEASRGSIDSGHYSVGHTAGSSPSSSSNSNGGPSSSCGTSPEPFTQSPMGFKPVDTLSTIGEEQSALGVGQGFTPFPGTDMTNLGFDWLAQQNGGQFDPQLFGDYREPQANILAGNFDDSFFNDALDADFLTPFNMPASPAVQKKNLIAEIDARQNADDSPPVEDIHIMKDDEKLSCTKMWAKLQNCSKVQNGEFDLDGLCSELQKKAKCSGNGPVVAERDFKSVVAKYMGKDGSCVDEALASKP